MQVFFAISCVLAALALSNGASIASNSEREVDQPRAEVEAQDAVVAASEETAGQSRAAEVQAKEEAAADAGTSDGAAVELRSAVDASTSVKQGSAAVDRAKRTLHRRRHGCGHAHHGACLGSGCGGAVPWAPNAVAVQQDVLVAQPVPVHVPVVKVVHQNVPVPQPVAVPVVNEVKVPVPVLGQPGPCCAQATLPCSPCSG